MEGLPKPKPRPGPTFLSPFSARRRYAVQWTKTDPAWKGVQNVAERLTERDRAIIQAVAQCQVVTSMQLAKAFWENTRQAGDRLKLLARCGVLVRHSLASASLTVPIYTLGPIGAQELGIKFAVWWPPWDTERTLSQLMVSQLFFRMRQLPEGKDTRLLPAPHPYQGVLVMGETEYAILVTRESAPDLRWANAKRMLVVAETEADLLKLAPGIRSSARYTTDEMLFTAPIHEVFWRHKNGQMEKEVVAFKPK